MLSDGVFIPCDVMSPEMGAHVCVAGVCPSVFPSAATGVGGEVTGPVSWTF